MKLVVSINEETLQDCINFSTGLFSPLKGFMNSSDYHSVVDNMCLSNNEVWTIPLTFDVDDETFVQAAKVDELTLVYKQVEVGTLEVEDCFKVDLDKDLLRIFKTRDDAHPGVKKERQRHIYRIGGKVNLSNTDFLAGALNPTSTKAYFKEKGWKTVAGFQTRNPVHKAHEHLQRIALELCDGLFINPLIGWKKKGDFSSAAVKNGYQAMLEHYYRGLNVYYDELKTPMRYAGPREAIFHAIIRRNLGCTHFIIGRDHAGVGDYYGKYEAQELAKEIMANNDLGIELLLLSEPFYCHKCGQIVSDKTCAHDEEHIEKISGTKIRGMLSQDKRPSDILMRKEVADSIIALHEDKFIRD